MNLIISGELTAPPSEIGAFRTFTLYASIFKKMDCIVECEKEEIDFYYHWLKRNYSYDFIKAMVELDEIKGGCRIKNSKPLDRMVYNNLSMFIQIL